MAIAVALFCVILLLSCMFIAVCPWAPLIMRVLSQLCFLRLNKTIITIIIIKIIVHADASGIVEAIMSFLEACGLNIKNMVEIATDRTSVMIGNIIQFTFCSNRSSPACS